jgi:transcriptional regulator with XRE-family HTH domain
MDIFTSRLRTVRRSQNITQGDLAKMAGTGQGTISRIEKGDQEPSLLVALKIAKALNVSLGYLAGDDTPQEDVSPDALTVAVDYDSLNDDQRLMIRASLDALMGLMGLDRNSRKPLEVRCLDCFQK